MLEYCEWLYHAHGFDKDSKVSRIKQWEQVEKSTGITPEGLRNKPNPSETIVYILEIYYKLSIGIQVLTHKDIESYIRVTGDKLSLWEIDVLFKIDYIRQKHGH